MSDNSFYPLDFSVSSVNKLQTHTNFFFPQLSQFVFLQLVIQQVLANTPTYPHSKIGSFFKIRFVFLRVFWCEPFLKSLMKLLQYSFHFMFWYVLATRHWGSSVSWPGIKPAAPALRRSLNHWTTREVSKIGSFLKGLSRRVPVLEVCL